MNHEIEVSNLMFNKTSKEEINFKKYDINVELEEESSNDQKTVLKYSLDLTSNPKNSVINISGNTILSGEQEEIEEFLKQEDAKTPGVVSLIYQELFPLMYIISKNMKIPSPSHTISQDNVQEIEKQDKKLDIENKKSVDVQPTNNANEETEIPKEEKLSQENEIKNESTKEIKEEQNDEDKN